MDRITSRPIPGVTDQHGRRLTLTGMIEASSGQRLTRGWRDGADGHARAARADDVRGLA